MPNTTANSTTTFPTFSWSFLDNAPPPQPVEEAFPVSDEQTPLFVEERDYCGRCDLRYPVSSLLPTDYRSVATDVRYLLCPGCRNALHTCSECGSRGTRGFSTVSATTYYCHPCTVEHLASCYNCGGWMRNDEAEEEPAGTRRYCPSCWDRDATECHDCGDLWAGGMHDTSIHPCVMQLRDLLESYSYKPVARFHPGYVVRYRDIKWTEPRDGEVIEPKPTLTPLYMGMELELEHDTCRGEAVVAAKELRDRYGKFLYLKHDSTVEGMELVTHPFTWPWAKTKFPFQAIADLESYGFVGEEGSENGMHVHVSKSAFTDLHLWRFVTFHCRNKNEVIQLARRENEEWANWDTAEEYRRRFSRSKTRPKGYMVRGRYGYDGTLANDHSSALNFGNPATVELRYFAPTLDPDVLKATFQWLDAAYHFTATIPTIDAQKNGLLGWSKFQNWVGEHDDTYPELVNYLDDLALL